MSDNASFVLKVIDALEDRRLDELRSYYHPEISFHWPPGFPYSGDHKGSEVAAMSQSFSELWGPLQPDDATRKMNARVVAAEGDTVVITYIWRAKDSRGNTFETPTSAHYRIRDGKLHDSRMFHFDLSGLIAFVENARR